MGVESEGAAGLCQLSGLGPGSRGPQSGRLQEVSRDQLQCLWDLGWWGSGCTRPRILASPLASLEPASPLLPWQHSPEVLLRARWVAEAAGPELSPWKAQGQSPGVAHVREREEGRWDRDKPQNSPQGRLRSPTLVLPAGVLGQEPYYYVSLLPLRLAHYTQVFI